MGLVIVVVSARVPPDATPSWRTYDLLPDPVGWVLVVLGVHALARVDDTFTTSRWLAVLAGAVSVPMWFPQLQHRLDSSGEWFASLPQILFCLVLVREIGLLAGRQSPPDRQLAQRSGLLVWGLVAAAVLPVLALGGGVSALESATVTVATLVNVALIYVLFRAHRRTWLGGPGELEVHPGRSGEREGRPPSS